MKKILMALLISTTSMAIDDKLLHLSVSYALSYTGMHLLPKEDRWMAPLLTLAVGLVKEISDTKVDEYDLLANGVGIGVSLVVIELE